MRRTSFTLAVCGLFVGCGTLDQAPRESPVARTARPATPPAKPVCPVAFTQPAAAAGGLDDLLALARARNPDLAAAVARVGEARGNLVQAGLYPNPTVGYSGNQINDGPGTAGQQGGFVSQEFVTGGKLRLAKDAAALGVTAADWHAASRWHETAARVKAAYYEHLAAAAALRETELMLRLFEQGLERTEKLAAGVHVESYDVSRLKVEVVQARNRVGGARQRVAAAARMLAVAVGVEHLAAGGDEADFDRELGVPDFDRAAEVAARSSFVLAAEAEAAQAEAEVRQAAAKPIPNVSVTAVGAHDYTTRAPTATVQVGVPLPLFDRNQGNVAAARSRHAALLAAVGQARLKVRERLATAYQRYENADRQLRLYAEHVIPDATAALTQVDKVYEAKGERFFDTLDARRVLTTARIEYANALGELFAAAAEIEAVAQTSPR